MRQIIKWNYDYMDLINTDNQYTFEECNRDGPVDAKYVLSSNPEFVGNPFVEALPKPRRKDSITNGYFMPIPLIDHKELKKMSIEQQKESVLSLRNLRLPLSFERQLEFINYDVITSSYSLRKPYCWNFDYNEQIDKKDQYLIRTKGWVGDSAPSGFSLLGYSGCGKSSALKQVFSNIPQVIIHHPSEKMQFVQITYLIVSCVPNSNFSSLYIQIGEAIDWALGYGSPIYEELIRRCRTLADKQLKVCELIEKLAIGTIILDEIQLIDFTSNKENSYEGLLAIVNKTKVALSVVGTDEAYQSLFSKLRNARRSGDYINASEYCKSEEFFDNLTKTLFMWQWFDDKVEWTKELSKALYVASKGLINQLIWIYKWMNLEYLDGKSKGKAPEINPSFVEKINKKHFGHLKNHLDLLKQIESERLNDQSIIAEAHKVNMKPIENEEALTLTKVQSEVVKIIRPLFPNFEVNMIEGAVKQLLSGEDLKTISIDELARNTLRTLQNKPIKKKIKRTTTKTNSKDICAYL